jgi:hypothetical protein
MLYTEIKNKVSDIKTLTKLGLINPVWLRNIEIFEQYHLLRDKNVCITCAYQFVADDYKISYDSVKKIIEKLSS